MSTLRSRLLSVIATLVCAGAGFALVRLTAPGNTAAPDKPAPREPAAVAFKPAWLALKGAARVSACIASLPGISTSDWPAVFTRQQDDELLRPFLAQGWAKADPGGFWAWLIKQKKRSAFEEFGPAILREWVVRDPSGALAGTAKLSIGPLRDLLRRGMIATLLDHDPAAGVALAAKAGPLRAGGRVATGWIERDPAAAARAMAALPSKTWSGYVFHACGEWAKRDPASMLAWLAEGSQLGNTHSWTKVFETLAIHDPKAALTAALHNISQGTEGRSQAIAGAIAGSALKLPAAEVIANARRELDGWSRQYALRDAIKNLASSDVAKAAALLAGSPPSGPMVSAASNLAENWSRTDWPAARQWVDTLNDSPSRRAAWKALSFSASPAQAAELAVTAATLPYEELSNDFLLNIRRTLKKQDPAAATQWLTTLPADRAGWAGSVE